MNTLALLENEAAFVPPPRYAELLRLRAENAALQTKLERLENIAASELYFVCPSCLAFTTVVPTGTPVCVFCDQNIRDMS